MKKSQIKRMMPNPSTRRSGVLSIGIGAVAA